MANNTGESHQNVLGTGKLEGRLPDGLQLQIAVDQLATEGSSEGLLTILAGLSGIDLSQTPIGSIPVLDERASAQAPAALDDVGPRTRAHTQAYHIGTTDTVNYVSNDYIFQAMQQQ